MATYGYARVSLKEIDAVRGRRAHAQEPGRLPIECERFQTIPASREVQQSKPICDLAVLPSLLIPCSEAVSGSRNSSKKVSVDLWRGGWDFWAIVLRSIFTHLNEPATKSLKNTPLLLRNLMVNCTLVRKLTPSLL
jgi:hypothetical protein